LAAGWAGTRQANVVARVELVEAWELDLELLGEFYSLPKPGSHMSELLETYISPNSTH